MNLEYWFFNWIFSRICW